MLIPYSKFQICAISVEVINTTRIITQNTVNHVVLDQYTQAKYAEKATPWVSIQATVLAVLEFRPSLPFVVATVLIFFNQGNNNNNEPTIAATKKNIT